MKRRNMTAAAVLTGMLILTGALTACSPSGREGADIPTETSDADAAEKPTDTEDGTPDTAEATSDAEPETVLGNFESLTLDGEPVTQDIFAEADLNMVNFWGTFCGPCIREMPDLGEIDREYRDQGFQIVGILTDVAEPKDSTALEIAESSGTDFTHIVASEDLINGILSSIQVVPTTIFVDREGKQVGEIHFGSKTKEEWAEIVEELLEQTDDGNEG